MQNKRTYKNLISYAIKTVESFREKTKTETETKINEIMNDEAKNEIDKSKEEQDKTLFKIFFVIAKSKNSKTECLVLKIRKNQKIEIKNESFRQLNIRNYLIFSTFM